jgi:hypothetical protein
MRYARSFAGDRRRAQAARDDNRRREIDRQKAASQAQAVAVAQSMAAPEMLTESTPPDETKPL